MMTVAYFCKATEIRFLTEKCNFSSNNTNCTINSENEKSLEEQKFKYSQGEYWHCIALKISCEFLPSSSPIVRHYLTSYSKHFGCNMEDIPEDEEVNFNIENIKGIIDSNEENNNLYRVERFYYVYDFKKDLEEKNKTLLNFNSRESSFDDSFEKNCLKIVENLKSGNENKREDINLFNKSSHRYAASARGEWDIIGDSQRLILRSQRNFEFLNKLDHRIEEENNKKISIDFKKFMNSHKIIPKEEEQVKTQNEDSFEAQETINNKNLNNDELLFIDSGTEKAANNKFIIKSKFKLDFKNLENLKLDEEKNNDELILEEQLKNDQEKNLEEKNSKLFLFNKEKIQSIKSDFIRKAVEKNLNALKQNLIKKGCFTERINHERNDNNKNSLNRNKSVENEPDKIILNQNSNIFIKDNFYTSHNFFKKDGLVKENNFNKKTDKNLQNTFDLKIKINNQTLDNNASINAKNYKNHDKNYNFNKNIFENNQNLNNFYIDSKNDNILNSNDYNDLKNNTKNETPYSKQANNLNKNEVFIIQNKNGNNINININKENSKINNNAKKIKEEAKKNKNIQPLISNRDKNSNNLFEKLLGNREIHKNFTAQERRIKGNNNIIISPVSSKEKYFSPRQNTKNTISNFRDIINIESNNNPNIITNNNNEIRNYSTFYNSKKNKNTIEYNHKKKILNFQKPTENDFFNINSNIKITLPLETNIQSLNRKEKNNNFSQAEMVESNLLNHQNNKNIDNRSKNNSQSKNSLQSNQKLDLKKNTHNYIDNKHNQIYLNNGPKNNLNINEIRKIISNNDNRNSKINSKEMLNNIQNLDFERKNFRSLKLNNLMNDEIVGKTNNKINQKIFEKSSYNKFENTENLINRDIYEKKQNEIENIKILFKNFSIFKNITSKDKNEFFNEEVINDEKINLRNQITSNEKK